MSMFGEIGKSVEKVVNESSDRKGIGSIVSEAMKDVSSILKDFNSSVSGTVKDMLPSLNLVDAEESQAESKGSISKIGEACAPAFDGAQRGSFPKISEKISESTAKAVNVLESHGMFSSLSEGIAKTATSALIDLENLGLGNMASEILENSHFGSLESLAETAKGLIDKVEAEPNKLENIPVKEKSVALSPVQEENLMKMIEKVYGKMEQGEPNPNGMADMSSLLKESMKNRSKLMVQTIKQTK